MIRLKLMADTDAIWQIANKWSQLFTGRLLPLPPVTQRLGGGCVGVGGGGAIPAVTGRGWGYSPQQVTGLSQGHVLTPHYSETVIDTQHNFSPQTKPGVSPCFTSETNNSCKTAL